MKHLVIKNGRVVKIFNTVAGADTYALGKDYDVISTTHKNVKVGDKSSKYGR